MDVGTFPDRSPSAQEIADGALVFLLFWVDAVLSVVLSAGCCWYVSSAGRLLA